ncbi:MAG: hypothetical protein E6123_13960, partial [Clostridiales bacterium]|nr:hypothetical protein [Clostridiales bacterium]
MKLNNIAKHLALAGVLTSLSISAFAVEQQDATSATTMANNALYGKLPFTNNTDFANAHRGFIAPLPQNIIKG